MSDTRKLLTLPATALWNVSAMMILRGNAGARVFSRNQRGCIYYWEILKISEAMVLNASCSCVASGAYTYFPVCWAGL